MLNKEQIEKAKDDLNFFYQGESITPEMEESSKIIAEYIEQLESKIKRYELENIPLLEGKIEGMKEHYDEIIQIYEQRGI